MACTKGWYGLVTVMVDELVVASTYKTREVEMKVHWDDHRNTREFSIDWC